MSASSVPQQKITELLVRCCEGNNAALAELTPLVYEELHRLAHYHMGGQRPDHTLQTTALVNEAYLRLADQTNPRWQNRAHFFAVAARAMRKSSSAMRGASSLKSGVAARTKSNWTKRRSFRRKNHGQLSICTRRWKHWPLSTRGKLKWSS